MSSRNINIPCQVTISADGSVSIKTVDAQNYTLSQADATFEGFLRDGLLNAFVVSNGADGEALRLAVDISGTHQGAFVSSLATQLRVAVQNGDENATITDADVSGNTNLEMYLANWAREQLLAELRANGVGAALEGGALENLEFDDFAADLSGGAVDMFEGIRDLSPMLRAVIATQMPNTKFMSYVDVSGHGGAMETFSSHLPIEAGDSMTFQFIITQNYNVTETAENVGESTANFSSIKTGTASGIAPLIGHYTVASRTVNIVLKRADAAANVGLVAAPANHTNGVLDAAIGEVTTAENNYAADVSESRVAFALWNTANSYDVSYNVAVKALTTSSTLYVNAVEAQRLALLDASGQVAGPLYDAAQAAIAKATQAALDLSANIATEIDLSANFHGLATTNGHTTAELLTDLQTKNNDVNNSFAALLNKQSLLVKAQAVHNRTNEYNEYKQEEHAAIEEAAADALTAANSVYAIRFEAYSDASGDLDALIVALDAADDEKYVADISMNTAQDNYDDAVADVSGNASAAQQLAISAAASVLAAQQEATAAAGAALAAARAAHTAVLISLNGTATQISGSAAPGAVSGDATVAGLIFHVNAADLAAEKAAAVNGGTAASTVTVAPHLVAAIAEWVSAHAPPS